MAQIDGLPIWVVYDHPTDFPTGFVARQFVGETPTENVIASETLERIREVLMVDMRLVKMERAEGDDPKIVETWL